MAAFLLLGICGITLVFFYVRLFGQADRPITDVDIALNSIAAIAGGWGIALLLPDRARRWAIWYMAFITPVGVVIAVLLSLAAPG
jgi:hypothetical protein